MYNVFITWWAFRSLSALIPTLLLIPGGPDFLASVVFNFEQCREYLDFRPIRLIEDTRMLLFTRSAKPSLFGSCWYTVSYKCWSWEFISCSSSALSSLITYVRDWIRCKLALVFIANRVRFIFCYVQSLIVLNLISITIIIAIIYLLFRGFFCQVTRTICRLNIIVRLSISTRHSVTMCRGIFHVCEVLMAPLSADRYGSSK